LRTDCTQIVYATAFAIDLYSASVLDLETIGCFFALHAIRLGPKNIAKLPVDRLSSIELAQSAFEKALISLIFDLLNTIP
jgi:hypothetical protein